VDFNIVDIEELKKQEQYKKWIYELYATEDIQKISKIIKDIKQKLIQEVIKLK